MDERKTFSRRLAVLLGLLLGCAAPQVSGLGNDFALAAISDPLEGRGVAAPPGGLFRSPQTGGMEWRWVGPDGATHDFTSAELEEFLRDATLVERVPLNVGINGIDRLLLEKDGVQLRAGFRDVDVFRRNQRVGPEFYMIFRDHYAFECAAYELAKLLGIDSVPPAVLRDIGRRKGSVQAWVESDLDYLDEDFKPPNALAWARQQWQMWVFDALIYNVDRNPGNLMSDNQYKLWLIDHTRAFQEKGDLFEADKVVGIERGVWERLQALDRQTLDRALGGSLESSQISYLWQRRDRLIEHINTLIEQRGSEDAVVY